MLNYWNNYKERVGDVPPPIFWTVRTHQTQAAGCQRQSTINKILTDANKRGQHIAGDDEIRIDIAVSNFVLNVQSGALAIPSRSTVPA